MAGGISRGFFAMVLVFALAQAIPEPAPGSGEFQRHLPALSVTVVQGTDALLPCDVNDRRHDHVNMVLWFKDQSGVPLYSLDARSGSLKNASHWTNSDELGNRTIFVVATGGPSHLRIANISVFDGGVFRCRIDFEDTPTRNYRVNLTVIAPPSRPTIYDAQGVPVTGVAGPFLEGFDLYLACHARRGEEVSWWLGSDLIDTQIDAELNMEAINILRISVSRGPLLTARLQCRACNPVVPDAVAITEVPLSIFLKPRLVRIVSEGRPISAGQPHLIKCDVWGTQPAPRILWLLNGEILSRESATVSHSINASSSSLTFIPTSTDDGQELICRAENPHILGSTLDDRRTLQVSYAPNASVVFADAAFEGSNGDETRAAAVNQGGNITLRCEVKANPQPDHITWLLNDKRLDYNDSIGIWPQHRRLQLRDLKQNIHAGKYECLARNDEGEGKSAAFQIRVLYTPRCRVGKETQRIYALLHTSVILRCFVDADPTFGVRFGWTHNATSRAVNAIPAYRIQLSSNDSLASILHYTIEDERDYGTLGCWATNSVGRQAKPCYFHVLPATLPPTPFDCSIANSSGPPMVVCKPGEYGDLEQHFLLEATPEQSHPASNDLHSMLNDEASTTVIQIPALVRPVFPLSALDPARIYRLAVFAVNSMGKSDPPAVLAGVRIDRQPSGSANLNPSEHALHSAQTINEKRNKASSPDPLEPMALVLGLAVGGAVVAVAAALAVCILVRKQRIQCRRRRRNSMTSGIPLDEVKWRRNSGNSGRSPYEDARLSTMLQDTVLVIPAPPPTATVAASRASVRYSGRASSLQEPEDEDEDEEDEGGGRERIPRRVSFSPNPTTMIVPPDLVFPRSDIALPVDSKTIRI